MNIVKPKEIYEQSTNYSVREATLDDAFQLAEINYNGWTQSYRGIIDDNFLHAIDLEKKKAGMIDFMKNGNGKSVCLVYELDGKILGFVHGGEKRDENVPYEAEIYAIYVDPSTQGKGIGKILMNSILETSYFKDKKSFYLRTLKNKPETRGFYEKLGGKVFAEKEHEIGGKKYPMVSYCREKKQ